MIILFAPAPQMWLRGSRRLGLARRSVPPGARLSSAQLEARFEPLLGSARLEARLEARLGLGFGPVWSSGLCTWPVGSPESLIFLRIINVSGSTPRICRKRTLVFRWPAYIISTNCCVQCCGSARTRTTSIPFGYLC